MDEQNTTNTTLITSTTPEHTADVNTTPATEPAPKRRLGKQLLIAIGIIVLGAVSAGGYYIYSTQYSPVAVVNGLKIARKEFNESVAMITQTASLQGADITDPNIQKEIGGQALEILVSNTLLLEGAHAKGFVATPEEVQAEYDTLVAELGGEEELTKRMGEVGLTAEKLRSNISDRIEVDAYLKSETAIDEITVPTEETQALYDSYKEGGVEIPPFDDIKGQLESQILAQKQQEIINAFIASLKEKATIETKI